MIWGGANGELEMRAARDGSRRLKGRFPYGKRAVLSDGGKSGKPQKEEFAPKAFAYRVNNPKAEIHLLVGHSYDRPLASRGAGTLDIRDSAEAVTFTATIVPAILRAGYAQDAMAGLEAGLITGLSPGFRIPPQRVSPNAEKVVPEDPAQGMAMIRTIFDALLFEFSLVTVPAYKDATVETADPANPPAAEIDAMDLGELMALAVTLNIPKPATLSEDDLRAAVKAALGLGESRAATIRPEDPRAGLRRSLDKWRAFNGYR